jgi:hypothetical protein
MPTPTNTSWRIPSAPEVAKYMEIIKDGLESPRLTDYEQKFVQDMALRFEEYHENTYFSLRQELFLQRLEQKIYGVG